MTINAISFLLMGYSGCRPAQALLGKENSVEMHAIDGPSSELPKVVFNDGGVAKVIFSLPPTLRPELTSVAVFAMPKAGSVLLDGIMRDLSDHIGLTYVSIMQEFFTIGLPDAGMPSETSAIFMSGGYCYGGFRYFPRRFEIPILRSAKPILLVRDPRDMLVSHYYSMRDSHPEPGRALNSVNPNMTMRDWARLLEIDEYVHKASETFRRFLTNYRTLLCVGYGARVFRYEDVIYRKPEWISDIAAHFGWDVSPEIVHKIGAKHDLIPEEEATTMHVRQVHPGNFKKKLRPETIVGLDHYFKDEMEFFGYEPFVG